MTPAILERSRVLFYVLALAVAAAPLMVAACSSFMDETTGQNDLERFAVDADVFGARAAAEGRPLDAQTFRDVAVVLRKRAAERAAEDAGDPARE